ncbi:DUF1127 domain-containing protein [Shimia sp.]|uniref:DUF1127 domain-containing protein n=1 Tax=Shimia sp. TaxID=1954381 RepID=UPI0035681934
MAFASTEQTAAQGTTGRLATVAADLLERLRKARLYRKTLNELSALPNAQLADMGLHRSMLKRVAYQAVYEV